VELEAFKRDGIRTLLSWFETEADFYQWGGSQFCWPMSEGQFRIHLESMDDEPPMLYPFGFYRMGQLMGYCELYGIHPEHRWARLSCVVIAPRFRKKGLGLDMLKQILAYGYNRLQLNRISIGVFDHNTAALALYRKAGFSPEGTLREHLKVGDSYWDCHILSLLRKEWLMRHVQNTTGSTPIPKAYTDSLLVNSQV
jgi:RimJ/RimL family protein N-acetyltransferase